jgi:hypothetical protein
VSEETGKQAALQVAELEHRDLELKGKSLPFGAWVIRVGNALTE